MKKFEYSIEFFNELFIGENYLDCNLIMNSYAYTYYIQVGDPRGYIVPGCTAVYLKKDYSGKVINVVKIIHWKP